jgi:hypothetical protein
MIPAKISTKVFGEKRFRRKEGRILQISVSEGEFLRFSLNEKM